MKNLYAIIASMLTVALLVVVGVGLKNKVVEVDTAINGEDIAVVEVMKETPRYKTEGRFND